MTVVKLPTFFIFSRDLVICKRCLPNTQCLQLYMEKNYKNQHIEGWQESPLAAIKCQKCMAHLT